MGRVIEKYRLLLPPSPPHPNSASVIGCCLSLREVDVREEGGIVRKVSPFEMSDIFPVLNASIAVYIFKIDRLG